LDIIKIVTVGVATALSYIVLKQTRPELAVIVGLTGSIVLLFMIIGGLSSVIAVINSAALRTGIKNEIITALLKIIGIGYLCEFASGICRDSGASSAADMVTLCGKVLILAVAIPIIEALIEIVLRVIP
jgi:stage III sporulation protein AD